MSFKEAAGFAVAALILLQSCGRNDRPIDGGYPIEFDLDPEHEAMMLSDPCARRERGGWHRSIGHCEAMTPPQLMSGVLVYDFEERSFVPGLVIKPDRNDSRRFTSEVEVDDRQIEEILGSDRKPSPGAEVIALKFIGRRSKYPWWIDCTGDRSYTYVVDRLLTSKYLGTIGAPDRPPLPSERPSHATFTPTGERGVVSELEKEALERCAGP